MENLLTLDALRCSLKNLRSKLNVNRYIESFKTTTTDSGLIWSYL